MIEVLNINLHNKVGSEHQGCNKMFQHFAEIWHSLGAMGTASLKTQTVCNRS